MHVTENIRLRGEDLLSRMLESAAAPWTASASTDLEQSWRKASAEERRLLELVFCVRGLEQFRRLGLHRIAEKKAAARAASMSRIFR